MIRAHIVPSNRSSRLRPVGRTSHFDMALADTAPPKGSVAAGNIQTGSYEAAGAEPATANSLATRTRAMGWWAAAKKAAEPAARPLAMTLAGEADREGAHLSHVGCVAVLSGGHVVSHCGCVC